VEKAVAHRLEKLIGIRAKLLRHGRNEELGSQQWGDEIVRFMLSQVVEGLTSAGLCRGIVAILRAYLTPEWRGQRLARSGIKVEPVSRPL